MRIRNLCIAAVLVMMFSFVSFSRSAFAASTAYGPESKRFGAGLYLGIPTGITVKGYLTEKWALDGIFAWSFTGEGFTLIGDATYDFFDIPVHASSFTLPFYAGVGGKLAFGRDGDDDGKTIAGIRVPVGVAMQFLRHPIEIFIEAAPGIEVIPEAEFDITGGVGARFYFF